MNRAQRYKTVIVIGMDGLDPKRVKAMIARGELPAFARLRDFGMIGALSTSNPAESPVAWSSLATGCNPGEHGIFDFIHRHAKGYVPYLSTHRERAGSRRAMHPDRYVTPRRRPGFWRYTSDQGVPTSVIRWPVTFPAEPVTGRFLAGLGVPDVAGRLGKHTFYTTTPCHQEEDKAVQVYWHGKKISTRLFGPPWGGVRGAKPMHVKMTIRRDGPGITLAVGPYQQKMTCGQWSDWYGVSFHVGPLRVCEAIVKFHLVSVEPDLKLLATPVQIDPSRQIWPLTQPLAYGQELAAKLDNFYTLGLPEDTHAVTDGHYDLDAFLQQVGEISRERRAMFDHELARLDDGLMAFVFDAGDRIQHMFWSIDDPQSPTYTVERAKKYRHVIDDLYREMDHILSDTLEASDEHTAVFVVSDHGFGPFRRAVHLNRWLIDKGFLALQRGTEGRTLLGDVDWSRTSAYALGFSSIYLNRVGREGQGIVSEEDAAQVLESLTARLGAARDHDTNEPMVRNLYPTGEIYAGPCVRDCPDLVVGFEPGYRASWQTALGGAPAGSAVVDNDSLWAADHLVDPSAVPGVLATNLPLHVDQPAGVDLAPTVLTCLGLPIPTHMSGGSWLSGGPGVRDEIETNEADLEPIGATAGVGPDGLSDAARKQLEEHLSDLGYL